MHGDGEQVGDEVQPVGESEPAARLKGFSIVIGEDTWHTAISLRRTVERAGATVAAMASHLEALEGAVEVPCDAVVMDLNLNNQLAVGLANRLANSGQKVVVLSGYRRPAALSDKIHAFLEKPCEPAALIAALAAAVKS